MTELSFAMRQREHILEDPQGFSETYAGSVPDFLTAILPDRYVVGGLPDELWEQIKIPAVPIVREDKIFPKPARIAQNQLLSIMVQNPRLVSGWERIDVMRSDLEKPISNLHIELSTTANTLRERHLRSALILKGEVPAYLIFE